MARLDDQIDVVAHWDEKSGSFMRSDLPKVYHLNLVYRVRQDGTNESFLRRARIVLNRKKILRIEHIG